MPQHPPSKEDPLGLHPKCPRCWGVMKLHAEPRGKLATWQCEACGLPQERDVSGYAESAGPADGKDPWKHRSAGMRCRTCMWFVPKEGQEAVSSSRGEVGRCRRHAPTMGGFPVVFEADWCGDHRLDETRA